MLRTFDALIYPLSVVHFCLGPTVVYAYSRPALKLRRRLINAPKRSGSGALRRRAV